MGKTVTATIKLVLDDEVAFRAAAVKAQFRMGNYPDGHDFDCPDLVSLGQVVETFIDLRGTPGISNVRVHTKCEK